MSDIYKFYPFDRNTIFSDPRSVATRTQSALGTGFLTVPYFLTPNRALSIAVLHDCIVCDKPPSHLFEPSALDQLRAMIARRIPFSRLADAIGRAAYYQVCGDGKYSAHNLHNYCAFLSKTDREVTYWEEFLAIPKITDAVFSHYAADLEDSLLS